MTEVSRDEAASWHAHYLGATRKFLMNAVVIDNEPFIAVRPEDTAPKTAMPADDGMGPAANDEGGTAENEDEDKDGERGPQDSESESRVDPEPQAAAEAEQSPTGHQLDIRVISDAFSDQEISCAFVLPDDNETSPENIEKRVLRAAKSSDIVVIDWKLQNDSSAITKLILEKLSAADTAENGRMRLICVYTGETTLDAVFKDAKEALEKGGISFKNSASSHYRAIAQNSVLLVVNKTDIPEKKLPNHLIEAFAYLADGLLPAFSMAAVAAVRRNVHHIATRFSADLDAAYVSNRLMTDPPGDVAELIRELFVSECDTALGLERVADLYLEPKQIVMWLKARRQPLQSMGFGGETSGGPHSIDAAFLQGLAHGRFDGGKALIPERDPIKMAEDNRQKISLSLFENNEASFASQRKFARLVAMKREAFGSGKMTSEEGWRPSMTLGTVLRLKREGQATPSYYYCLTPACDTLRAYGDEAVTFLFIRVEQATELEEKGNLIIADSDGQTIKLRLEPKPRHVESFRFKPDAAAGRVLANKGEDGSHTFTELADYRFEWMGEVRGHRSQQDMIELNREWLRAGINDAEYLRQAGRGKAKL